MPVRPSAGIGVVEMQQFEVFLHFGGARTTLYGDRRGRSHLLGRGMEFVQRVENMNSSGEQGSNAPGLCSSRCGRNGSPSFYAAVELDAVSVVALLWLLLCARLRCELQQAELAERD